MNDSISDCSLPVSIPHSSKEEYNERDSFIPERLALLDCSRIPKHIAIIMDGNRRWAKERGLPPIMGHWEGAETLTSVVRAASELGIETLTVYAFSTENWSRSTPEIEALMHLFEVYLKKKQDQMVQDGIRLDCIGDLEGLPLGVKTAFLEVKEQTKQCRKIDLVLAINYGARDEIRRAFVKILQEHEKKPISLSDLTERFISSHLDTSRWKDPDLVIRTSGELRLSNFLLWQISYSEIRTTDVYWPDFSPDDLLDAVLWFQKREKRVGGG